MDRDWRRPVLVIGILAVAHFCVTVGYYSLGPAEPSWLLGAAGYGMFLPATFPGLVLVCYLLDCTTSEAVRVIRAVAVLNSSIWAIVIYTLWAGARAVMRRQRT